MLMKLFYSPGACSLSPHIALLEAGIPFTLSKVDLKNKKVESGEDFNGVNGKGYVPVLQLDNGQILTEGSGRPLWSLRAFKTAGDREADHKCDDGDRTHRDSSSLRTLSCQKILETILCIGIARVSWPAFADIPATIAGHV
jgi:Glutathione S-transferase, N-terminal domain